MSQMVKKLDGSVDADVSLARQTVLTSLLFGVDFVPVRTPARGSGPGDSGGGKADAAEPSEGEVPAAAARVGEPADGRPAERSGAPPDTPPDTRPDIPPAIAPEAPGDRAQKAAALAALAAAHDRDCPHCTAADYHSRTVFGEGDPDAELMFIGEAPGEQEDRTGRPFVGRAGKKLDEILAAMGMQRQQVYIANILKSRPPNNRTPLQHEVEACAVYLAEQIQVIRPKVIVALGGPAAKFLLDTTTGITRLRGQWAEYRDLIHGLVIPVMPTFHPAYLLRNYTPDTRRKVWSDMQAVQKQLAEDAG